MNETITEISADAVASWKAALGATRAAIAELDRELLDVSSAALAGDGPAVERRAQLLDRRAQLLGREDELDAGIRSGELHLQRQAEEAREAERAEWRAKAEALREDQRRAARRVDAALAELEAGYVEFGEVTAALDTALVRAGQQPNRSVPRRGLFQACHASAPTVARKFRVGVEWRAGARRLEDLVQ